MKIITQVEKEAFSFTAGKVKTQARKDVETLKVGQSALFKQGEDYEKYPLFYGVVHGASKTMGRKYEIKLLSDKTGAVVTRLM